MVFFAVVSIRLITQELRDVTHNVHYENYRTAKLSGIAQESHFQTRDGKDPMSLMEAEKKEHEAKMRKMEAEMESVFEQKASVDFMLYTAKNELVDKVSLSNDIM